jgi:DUF971 family protein
MTSPVQALEVCNHGIDGVLEITWSDGITGRMAHRLLREACRCAHCTAATRGGSSVQAEAAIRITAVEPWGNNTLRLSFDDGHQRGLYPFDYLRSLAVPV